MRFFVNFALIVLFLVFSHSTVKLIDFLGSRVAIYYVENEETGLRELSRNLPLAALNPEQLKSVVFGNKVVAAVKYLLWVVNVVIHVVVMVFLAFYLAAGERSPKRSGRLSGEEKINKI